LPGNSSASDCSADIEGLSWGLPARGELLRQGAERHAATRIDLLERSLHETTGCGGVHEQGSFELVLGEDTEKSRRDTTYRDHHVGLTRVGYHALRASLNCVALLNTIGMARLPGVLPSHDASIPNRSRFSRQTTCARYVSL
jgi:hypothetical protein